MNDLGAIRERIIASADLYSYACEAGFRPAAHRKGWYHHGTADKTPSAHARGDGLYCFHCSSMFSKVDLIMLRDGHSDYMRALRTGAEELGIEWRSLGPRQRAEKRAERQLTERIATDAGDWVHGLNLRMQERKREVMGLALRSWHRGNDELGDALAAVVGRIPRAVLSPADADPAVLVRSYRASALKYPEATRRVLKAGKDDRMDAEEVTHWIVDMIALAAERQPGSAA